MKTTKLILAGVAATLLATNGAFANDTEWRAIDNHHGSVIYLARGTRDQQTTIAFGGQASTQVGITTALDALLFSLGNNGGPTIGAFNLGAGLVLETEALMGGSPALSKGVPGGPTTDERGLSILYQGKVNIGAV